MSNPPLLPLTIAGIGAYLCWFGVHYWESDITWPSDPIKAVLTGKPLPANTIDNSALATALTTAATSTNQPGSTVGEGGLPGSGTIGGVTGTTAYTHNTLEQLWTSTGGSVNTANLAAAIAQAESSGNAGALSSNPDGGQNVGLWQLDTKGEGAGYTVSQLQDPDTNARITIMKTANGTNWGPWETYHTGAYKKYLVNGPVNPTGG